MKVTGKNMIITISARGLCFP